jgi:hypothetical protein
LKKYTVCLVHLGEEETPHLWSNLEYLNRNFNDVQCVLVGDSSSFLKEAEKRGFFTHFYLREEKLAGIFERMQENFDFEFRNGFWRYSLERLFAVSQFHQSVTLPIMHIESDILLMPNFPWEKMYGLGKIGWQSLSPKSDVASIVFSPSSDQSEIFCNRLFKLIENDSRLTDMTVLARMREEFGRDYVTIPSAPITESDVFNEFGSLEAHRISSYADYFGGYFDSAPLGMYNFGQDPRNNFGFSVLHKHMPESILDPSKIALKLDTVSSDLTDQTDTKIFSLHIHSKNLDVFSENSIQTIEKYLQGVYSERNLIFDYQMFSKLLLDYKRRHKLLELLANVPLLTRLNKYKVFRAFKRIIKNVLR